MTDREVIEWIAAAADGMVVPAPWETLAEVVVRHGGPKPQMGTPHSIWCGPAQQWAREWLEQHPATP